MIDTERNIGVTVTRRRSRSRHKTIGRVGGSSIGCCIGFELDSREIGSVSDSSRGSGMWLDPPAITGRG